MSHPNIYEQTRGACRLACYPCHQTQCRYHLGVAHLDAALLHDDDTLPTCALEVASHGAHTLDQISELLGVTTERVRQLEAAALRKLRACHSKDELLTVVGSESDTCAAPTREYAGLSTSGLGSVNGWGFAPSNLVSH